MSRKTWPCGHHTSEGIIDGTALNQGQGLKSPGSPWPWPSGARTRWVVVLSSSAFCSAPPQTIALPFSGSPVRVLSRGPGSLGGLLLDAPPWVGLGLKRPSPAQVVASEDALGRCPGPGSVPAAIPGPAWRLCFYLLILFYPAFFVVFLRRAHLSNLPAQHRAACACMFSAGLPVILSSTRRASGPTLCRGAGCGRRRLGPACARPPAETVSAGSPVRLS